MVRKDRKPGFKIENGNICLVADLRRGGPPRLLENLTGAVKQAKGGRVNIDLSNLERLDSLGGSLLAEQDWRATTILRRRYGFLLKNLIRLRVSVREWWIYGRAPAICCS